MPWGNKFPDMKNDPTYLEGRLSNAETSLAEKANQTYVDNQIQNMSSNVQGFYATVSALTSAFPTGNTSNYVVTADNYIYRWNGSAWASTGYLFNATAFADKSIAPAKTTFFDHGKNLIDYTKTTSGYYVDQTNGNFTANASHRRTDKLVCKPNQAYIFSYRNKTTGADIGNNNSFRYACYDVNGTYITGAVFSSVTPTFTTPANASTIAISWNQTNDATYNIQLEEGSTVTSFAAYAQQILESYLNLTNTSQNISNLQLATYKPTNIISDDNFLSSIPSYLTNNGGFTLSSGLVSPATTGYDKQIYYNKDVCLDREKIYVDMILSNLSTVIGVGFRSSIAGLLCEVDFINNKLIIRSAWSDPTSTTAPSVFLQTPLTFTPVLNRKYSIIVEKDTRKNCSITITDKLTNSSTKLDCVAQGSTSPTNAWGGACIVAIAGSFTVTKFVFLNNQPSSPALAIVGDSFVEGTTIMPNVEQRYAAQIKSKLNGNCIIAGKGGDYAYGVTLKTATLGLFRPKYTLLAIGINDTDFTQYQTSMNTLISWCQSIGSIPILQTITRMTSPATDNLTMLQQINAWVRGSGYKYVDFAKVMSLNYDGETQNTSLTLTDGIHPNLTGHTTMFNKFVADFPEIFDVA